MDWNELPSYEEVQAAYRTQAKLKAEIDLIELEIKIIEAGISKAKPRDPAARFLGLDPKQAEELSNLRDQLIDLNKGLYECQANLAIYDYHRDAFKALSFAGRL